MSVWLFGEGLAKMNIPSQFTQKTCQAKITRWASSFLLSLKATWSMSMGEKPKLGGAFEKF